MDGHVYWEPRSGDWPSDESAAKRPNIEQRLSRIEDQLRVIADAIKAGTPRQTSEPIKQSIGECGCQYGPCVHRFWTIGEDVKKRSEPVSQTLRPMPVKETMPRPACVCPAYAPCQCRMERPSYRNVMSSVVAGRGGPAV